MPSFGRSLSLRSIKSSNSDGESLLNGGGGSGGRDKSVTEAVDFREQVQSPNHRAAGAALRRYSHCSSNSDGSCGDASSSDTDLLPLNLRYESMVATKAAANAATAAPAGIANRPTMAASRIASARSLTATAISPCNSQSMVPRKSAIRLRGILKHSHDDNYAMQSPTSITANSSVCDGSSVTTGDFTSPEKETQSPSLHRLESSPSPKLARDHLPYADVLYSVNDHSSTSRSRSSHRCNNSNEGDNDEDKLFNDYDGDNNDNDLQTATTVDDAAEATEGSSLMTLSSRTLMADDTAPPKTVVRAGADDSLPIPTTTTAGTTTTTTATTPQTQRQPSHRRIRRVHHHVAFSSVEVRDYDRTVGDHPSCSSGPPLSIDWTFHPNVQTYTVHDYELMQGPTRRTEPDLIVPRLAREEMLLFDWNVSTTDLAHAVALAVRTKNQRRQTAHAFLTPAWRTVDSVWEHATSKLLRRDESWRNSTKMALNLERQHLAHVEMIQQQELQQQQQTTPISKKTRVKEEKSDVACLTIDSLNPTDKEFDYAQYYLHLYQNQPPATAVTSLNNTNSVVVSELEQPPPLDHSRRRLPRKDVRGDDWSVHSRDSHHSSTSWLKSSNRPSLRRQPPQQQQQQPSSRRGRSTNDNADADGDQSTGSVMDLSKMAIMLPTLTRQQQRQLPAARATTAAPTPTKQSHAWPINRASKDDTLPERRRRGMSAMPNKALPQMALPSQRVRQEIRFVPERFRVDVEVTPTMATVKSERQDSNLKERKRPSRLELATDSKSSASFSSSLERLHL